MYYNNKNTKYLKNIWKSTWLMALVLLLSIGFAKAQSFALVKDINTELDNGSDPQDLKVFNNNIYFNAYTNATGREIWKSDATAAGTVLLKDINPGEESGIEFSGLDMVVLDGHLFFAASNGTQGRELWKTDGTAEGTVMVKDITPDEDGSSPVKLYKYDGRLYFSASDDSGTGEELWTSDGTTAGTYMVKDILDGEGDSNPTEFFEFNGLLYFSADLGYYDKARFWRTDGTIQGTEMVLDIGLGRISSAQTVVSGPSFTISDGKLYFDADDDDHGAELWASGGSSAGTYLVKDIADDEDGDPFPNPGDSDPHEITDYNGKVYFRALEKASSQHQLFYSDGTASGTGVLKEIFPGTTDGNYNDAYPRDFFVYDGLLYFKANDAEHGFKFWVTDGTEAGTQLYLENILTPTSINDNIIFNDKWFFLGLDDNNNRQIWETDGTATGTQMHVPNNTTIDEPFGNPSQYFGFVEYQGALYFAANYDDNGLELWKFGDNLSTESINKNNIRVYPNPVQDVLHIETYSKPIQNLTLFSITGKKLESWHNRSAIDLSAFFAGIYFLKMRRQNGSNTTRRIIKD